MLVHDADRAVGKLGSSSGDFSLEPLRALVILRKCFRQHLQLGIAAQLRVGGAMHLAHRAGADLAATR
jgi:hypothetical protein